MSDRTSQAIFAQLFPLILEHVPEPRRAEFANEVWEMQKDCDFHPRDMDVDETLVALGLAWRAVDPRYPDDGEQVLYKGDA